MDLYETCLCISACCRGPECKLDTGYAVLRGVMRRISMVFIEYHATRHTPLKSDVFLTEGGSSGIYWRTESDPAVYTGGYDPGYNVAHPFSNICYSFSMEYLWASCKVTDWYNHTRFQYFVRHTGIDEGGKVQSSLLQWRLRSSI